MSRIPFEKFDLGYPPWTLQFDPYNRGYLVVGGGNGEGQKEVPNRLTLLNVSLPGPIKRIAEVEVSDDNPASLGLRASKDGATAFVGANSGLDARKKGKNEHFRAFDVKYPPRGGDGSGGAISASRSTTLFSAGFVNSKDGFQRLLKLSPPRLWRDGCKRIGAIASSLSGRDEIVFFDATVAFPTANDVIHRIELDNKAEVNDLDLYEDSEGEFGFAYCTNKDVYSGSISYDFAAHKLKSKVEAPTLQHHLPASSKVRTKYRCLRFINGKHIMVLVNCGPVSELQLLKVFPKDGPGNIVLRMAIPRRLGAAVDFDTSVLDADQNTGDCQVVVAVAGQRNDVSVFTLDFSGKGAARNFRAFTHINGLHELSMKKVLLSPFYSPYDRPQKDPEKPAPPRRAFLSLASISLSNTVVVDHLPLDTVKTSSPKPRHILNSSSLLSRAVRTGSNLFVIAFVLLVSLLLAQSVLDARAAQGQVSPVQLIPQQIRSFIYQARQDSDPVKQAIREVADGQHHRLRDLLHHHHGHEEGDPDAKTAVVMRLPEEGEAHVDVEVHDDHASAVEKLKAVRWDDMSPTQQALWKKRLAGAGRWTASEGETILKSIFFSELAGAVGRAAFG